MCQNKSLVFEMSAACRCISFPANCTPSNVQRHFPRPCSILSSLVSLFLPLSLPLSLSIYIYIYIYTYILFQVSPSPLNSSQFQIPRHGFSGPFSALARPHENRGRHFRWRTARIVGRCNARDYSDAEPSSKRLIPGLMYSPLFPPNPGDFVCIANFAFIHRLPSNE